MSKTELLITKSDKPVKLDLACGQRKTEGFIGVDVVKTKDADYVMDLEKFPWPIEDGSVDEIVCNHYIEHTKDIIAFMDEMYRILKPVEFDPKNPNQPIRGFARITAPYYNSIRCWQDPTHTRAISEASFLYYNKGWREQNGLDHYPIKSDFDFHWTFNAAPALNGKNQDYVAFAAQHYTNVINDIIVTVLKRP